MGMTCSTRKPHRGTESSTNTNKSMGQSVNAMKEALDYCDSVSLANMMRSKPQQEFLADLILKQHISHDCVEQLVQRIEGKSGLILRCYNEFTNQALKIKQKVLDFYTTHYVPYMTQQLDTEANRAQVQNFSIQLFVEAMIILNCLMDKNFNEETELWWCREYYASRMLVLPPPTDKYHMESQMAQPIFYFLSALRSKVESVMSIQQRTHARSLINSNAIAQVHLTQFYNDMKMDFAKNVEEEEI